MFITLLFTITKTWKKLKCPLTDEWIKKLWYVYTYINIYVCVYIYMEYYSAIKKE